MNVQGFETALRMPDRPGSTWRAACSTGRRCMTPSWRTAPRLHRLQTPSRGIPGHWRLPAAVLASALLLASCVGSGQPAGERNLSLTSTEASETLSPPETRTAGPAAQNGAVHPSLADPTAGLPGTATTGPRSTASRAPGRRSRGRGSWRPCTAPFQDDDDAHGWHDGERSPDADRIDFHHSGVCSSVMAIAPRRPRYRRFYRRRSTSPSSPTSG